MKWLPPTATKMYEALGAVADGRVEVAPDQLSAKVWSSTRNKYYTITYDPTAGAIMSNDNGAFWKGKLGYPPTAFLMQIGRVSYDPAVGAILKGVKWKDINQKYKNDYATALEEILADKTPEEKRLLADLANKAVIEVAAMDLDMLGPKVKPPEGY